MSAQDHALRIHSSLCRIWDELVLRVEQLPADGSYPRPKIQQDSDNVFLTYPNCCSYVISADGSAICKEHNLSEDASTPAGAFGVAYNLVRYMTGNSYPTQLQEAGLAISDQIDID